MGKSRKSRSNSRSYSRSPSRGYKKDRHFHSRAVKIFYEHSSREDSPSRRERESQRTRSRSSSKHRRYDRSGTKTKRRDSRSRSSSRGKRVIFDFEVFVESQYIKRLTENNEYIIKRIKNDIGIYRIDFDHELSIPGLDGSVIKLSDDSYTRKSDALLSILKEIQYQKGNDRGSRRDYHEHTVTILVPEGMVSLLIGSKGKQINNIMRESRAHVIVNPAIHKMTYRTVKIDGKPEYIASACKIIYKTLEKVSPNVEKIEKTPQPLELHKTRITAKLVFPKNSVGFIIGKEGSWIKDLCDKCLVSIKFQQDDSIRCVKDEEAICIIKGKLSGVINAIVIILRRAHEYENISKHYASDVIKLLIPNNFVNKLIGAKGCMIREIAAKSGGAQIKIMSDKQTEKEYQDCVVAIAGSLANKQDAVCYILEQIEIFKNGGPILVNGKAINDNLAQQFRHSIPPRDSTGNQRRSSIDELNEPYIKEEENATDEEYYSRGTQDAKRRSRSRSVHSLQENDLNKPASNRKMSEEVGVNIYEAYPSTHQDNINVKVENEIVTKQEQVVLTDPRTEIYKKLDHSSEKRNSHSPTNEKLSPNRNSAKHNFRRRNSRSKSNSYSRSRSRSKSLSVRELANKISRSPSISKVTSNYNKSHYNRDECDKYHKDSPRSKQLAHEGSERKDVTKNSHYVDSKGDMRITTTVIVPNYLVPYLIGKNGEVIKNIETKTTAKISFQRENKTNDSIPVNTAEGIRGRIVSIAGPLSSMIEAFGLLTDEIIKLEKSINGTRYEKS